MKKKNSDIKKIIKKRIEIVNNQIQDNTKIYKRKLDNTIKNDNNVMNKNNTYNKKTKDPVILYKSSEIIIDQSKTNRVKDINNVFDVIEYDIILKNNIFFEKFSVLFFVSNYMRQEMLMQIINDFNSYNRSGITLDYLIYDDVSDYRINDSRFIVNDEHRGKLLYWKTFNEMFQKSKELNYDLYCFIPNDFLNIDIDRIINYAMPMNDYYYIFNIVNDGRLKSWSNDEPKNINNEIRRIYFTDCGFFTNRKTLEKLEFKIDPILNVNVNSSSGVGKQLTKRINALNIPIFMPIKSIAYHGDHESLMNPDERKINKLISR